MSLEKGLPVKKIGGLVPTRSPLPIKPIDLESKMRNADLLLEKPIQEPENFLDKVGYGLNKIAKVIGRYGQR